MAKKLILDLDTGIDDALALTYAFASPEFDLIGVTCTYGNVLIDQGCRNVLDICDFFGRSDVPVYRGLPHALAKEEFYVQPISAFIHGANGIGNVELPHTHREVEHENAVDFIIKAAHTYGEDLVIVPTGPQTNLAAAFQQDPDIVHLIGKVVLMGGALTVCGNVSPWSEANIAQDPEACNITFRSGMNGTMVGLDVTLQTLLTYRHTQEWRQIGTPQADFLADMTDYYIKSYETTSPHLGGCGLHDPLAMGVACDPSFVTTLGINMKCDIDAPTRGRTIGDNDRLNDPHKSMHVAVTVDSERYLKEFMARIARAASMKNV